MPDLNVWLALTWVNHRHAKAAWGWFSPRDNDNFYFCRFTQIGLLRLLTTGAIMGKEVLTVGEAWKVYDRWLEDSRIILRQEPAELTVSFRAATRPFSRLSAPKALGDCYLSAISQVVDATLVTFDRGLASACQKAGHSVVLLD